MANDISPSEMLSINEKLIQALDRLEETKADRRATQLVRVAQKALEVATVFKLMEKDETGGYAHEWPENFPRKKQLAAKGFKKSN